MGSTDQYRSIQDIRRSSKSQSSCPDTVICHKVRGRRGSKRQATTGLFRFSAYVPTPLESPPEGFPYTAVLGSPRCHLGSGTRTAASARIGTYALVKGQTLEAEVEMSLEDGASLGIRKGKQSRSLRRTGQFEGGWCSARGSGRASSMCQGPFMAMTRCPSSRSSPRAEPVCQEPTLYL